MAKEHRDLSVAKITATATIIAALIGAAASIAVSWISARSAAPPAIDAALEKRDADIEQLQISVQDTMKQVTEIQSLLRDAGNVAYCKMPNEVASVDLKVPKVIDFSTVVYDRYNAVSIASTDSTWKFRAKKAGSYTVSVSIGCSGTEDGMMTMGLFKNRGRSYASADQYLSRQRLGGRGVTLNGTTTVDLKENEFFDIRVYLEGDKGIDATIGGAGLTWIRIGYLGEPPSVSE